MRVKAALLATLMVIASACSSAAPAPLTSALSTDADIDLTAPTAITLWHGLSGSQQKALDELVAEFNATNGKKITVTALLQGNYTQLYQKTLGAIQAGSLPELAHAYESFVADYTKAGVVVDLGPYVASKKNGLSDKDDIYKPYFDTNTFPQFGNKLLSFPFSKSMFVMYVNDDMLKAKGLKTPQTWDEFDKAVQALTIKDAAGKTTQYGWAVPLGASDFNAWVLSRGGNLMSADQKTVAWNGKEGVEAVRIIDRLVKGGYAQVPKGYDYQNDFGAGKLAFFMGSTSTRPFIKDAIKGPLNWSIAQIPQTDPAKAHTVQYGANVAVLKSTPEKQLASWLFVKWFNDKERTAKWATTSYYMPARKTAAESALLKEYWAKTDTQGKQAFDLLATTVPEPNVRGQQDIRDVIQDALTAVTAGKSTPEDAMKTAGDKANAILKDNQ
ncbi:MAG: ABC transporter substrate-binding protein [Chloroflexi bacterium]|nr:ABC transporter substrate-binding protein [Chloroflexota bacterium]